LLLLRRWHRRLLLFVIRPSPTRHQKKKGTIIFRDNEKDAQAQKKAA